MFIRHIRLIVSIKHFSCFVKSRISFVTQIITMWTKYWRHCFTHDIPHYFENQMRRPWFTHELLTSWLWLFGSVGSSLIFSLMLLSSCHIHPLWAKKGSFLVSMQCRGRRTRRMRGGEEGRWKSLKASLGSQVIKYLCWGGVLDTS